MARKKEHKHKSRKKHLLVKTLALIAGLAIVLFIVLNLTQKAAVFSVNGQKITQDYIDKQSSMNLNEQLGYEELINQTINRILLLQAAKNNNIETSKNEVDQQINDFLSSRMLAKNELEARLNEQDMSWNDFENNYKEQLIINKLLNAVVFADLKITDVDIALYYKEHKEELNQSFDVAKDEIRRTIEQNKKQELLNKYIDKLKQDAKIEYFGGYKKIKEMEEFAKCLSEKSVLYGASWCLHCKSQKEMFGSSVKYIKFVDCEASIENQNECIAKGLQAYPAWEIDGRLYLGEKSFKELSELSGCIFNQ